MSNSVHDSRQEIDTCMAEGLANCRKGRFDQGVLGVNSAAGKHFEDAYRRWMTLRAQAGDPFARSLGY